MNNFDDALKKIAKGQGRYVGENKQLNQEGINILLPVAKKLIIESGISENDLRVGNHYYVTII